MKLFPKLVLTFIFIGLSVLTASFYVSYVEIERSLTKIGFERLTATRDGKKREIESYFHGVQQQLITLSGDLMVVEAAAAFNAALKELADKPLEPAQLEQLRHFYQADFLGRYQKTSRAVPESGQLLPPRNAARHLQYEYIADSTAGLDQKFMLDQGKSDNSYNSVHARFHPVLREYQQRFGFYDLFIVDMEGNVVYSVFKEIDYATNLLRGPHKESGLAEIFRNGKQLGQGSETTLVDFSPYLPSYGEPAAFIASQIRDGGGPIGVLVFQLPIDKIDAVLTSNRNWREEGYGESGETYIVASDFGMRNDSRFLIEEPERYLGMLEKLGIDRQVISNIRTHNTSIHFQKVRTEATRDAMQGNSNTRILKDYRGVDVLSSYAPLKIEGLNWVLLSEIDAEEVFQPIASIRQQIIVLGLVISLLLVMIATLFARRITIPIQTLAELAARIGGGEFAQKIPVKSRDEVGGLATAFNRMSDSLQRTTVSKEYLDQILHSMNEALFVLRASVHGEKGFYIQTINQATERLLGQTEAQILGKNIDAYFEGGSALSDDDFKELSRAGLLKPSDRLIVSADGSKVPVMFSVSLMRNSEGIIPNSFVCVCIAQDITERKRTEEKLKLLSTVFNNSIESIILADANGDVIDCNSSFEFITGFSKAGLLHMSVDNVKVKEQEILSLKKVLQQTEAGSTWRGELTAFHKNGAELPFIVSCSAVMSMDNEIANYVFVMSDIADLKEKEQRIINIANHDALTGLPNRNLFDDRLNQAIKSCDRNKAQLALMYIDLDGFKDVNDTHGHQAGDELLIEVSHRIGNQLRERDTVARLGGDEFVIMIEETNTLDDAQLCADKVLNVINQPFKLSMATVNVSGSIGVAGYPQHADDQDSLVKAADAAMYQAKKSGKNNIKFAES